MALQKTDHSFPLLSATVLFVLSGLLRVSAGSARGRRITFLLVKDEFWLEYEWLNPYKDRIETKRSFFKKIILADGRKAWIGCGFWKDQEI